MHQFRKYKAIREKWECAVLGNSGIVPQRTAANSNVSVFVESISESQRILRIIYRVRWDTRSILIKYKLIALLTDLYLNRRLVQGVYSSKVIIILNSGRVMNVLNGFVWYL